CLASTLVLGFARRLFFSLLSRRLFGRLPARFFFGAATCFLFRRADARFFLSPATRFLGFTRPTFVLGTLARGFFFLPLARDLGDHGLEIFQLLVDAWVPRRERHQPVQRVIVHAGGDFGARRADLLLRALIDQPHHAIAGRLQRRVLRIVAGRFRNRPQRAI